MKPFIPAVSAVALCLAPAVSRAEEPTAARPPHSVVYEMYAFSGTVNGQATSVIAPALFATFALSERVSLQAAWFFAYAPARLGAPASFQAGNPSIGPGVVLWDGAWRVRTGAGLALPFTLLTDPDDRGSALLRRAATLRGNSGFGLVSPGLMALTPWVDASVRRGLLRFGVDGRVPLSAQLSEKRTRRVDAVVQLSANVGLDLHSHVLLGSTFQAIYVATAAEGSDRTFLALVPSVRLHGKAGFVEARLTLNLDTPLGFSFSPDGVWAAGVAMGTTF